MNQDLISAPVHPAARIISGCLVILLSYVGIRIVEHHLHSQYGTLTNLLWAVSFAILMGRLVFDLLRVTAGRTK